MAFPNKFGGGPPDDSDSGKAPPFQKKKSGKPFGRKGGFQKKGFSPAMKKSMSGGGRF